MEKQEAINVLVKQVRDYDDWAGEILSALMSSTETCKHPYPMWYDKHNKPNKCSCMICGKKLEFPKDVHRTWHVFDKQERVNEAIKIVTKMED